MAPIPRVPVSVRILALAGALALPLAVPAVAHGGMFVTSLERTLVTAGQRSLLGLRYWPDGPMGIERRKGSYVFHAPNGPDVARSKGTLDDPLRRKVTPSITVQGARALTDVGYASGGPIYRDRKSGLRLMFVHLERFPGTDPRRFYGTIGLARSADGGRSWHFLGEIFTPRLTYSSYKTGICGPATGATFGQYVIRRVAGARYFYMYSTDPQGGSGCPVSLAVARARVSDVLRAARAGDAARWSKYLNGAWSEPGIGGRSTDIWAGGQRSFAVSRNRRLDRYLMVMARQETDTTYSLVISRSADGVSWSAPERLFTVSGEVYAPTIAGRRNPAVSGRRFLVYYSNSLQEVNGGFRWNDAALRQRVVTVP